MLKHRLQIRPSNYSVFFSPECDLLRVQFACIAISWSGISPCVRSHSGCEINIVNWATNANEDKEEPKVP